MKKIISIIFVAVWMIVVFYFSSQGGQSSTSSSKRVANAVVNIININGKMDNIEKQELVDKIDPYIRKLAHYTIYIIGGILITNAIYAYMTIEERVISKSLTIGILYAISDEIHQLFVNGRSGKVTDVIIDSLGVLTGIVFFLIVEKIVKKIKENIKGGA